MLKAIVIYGVASCIIAGLCSAERDEITMNGQIVASKVGFLRLPGNLIHAEYLFRLNNREKGLIKLVYSSPTNPPKKLTEHVLNIARMLRIKAKRDKSCNEVYGSFNRKIRIEYIGMQEEEVQNESRPREINGLFYIKKAEAVPPPDGYMLECYSVSDTDIKVLR